MPTQSRWLRYYSVAAKMTTYVACIVVAIGEHVAKNAVQILALMMDEEVDFARPIALEMGLSVRSRELSEFRTST